MKNWTADKIVITVLLSVIGFFLMQTFFGIKNMEKDIVTIRVQLAEFKAKHISREQIEKIIKDYHDNHPCTRNK